MGGQPRHLRDERNLTMRGKRRADGRVKDAFGAWFHVSEYRGTRHGFDVILGWPSGKRRGTGGAGRPGVILTPALVRHLERFRMNPGKADLPLGWSAIQRIREKLGHHIRRDIRRWWEKRRKDLASLSGFKFAGEARQESPGRPPHDPHADWLPAQAKVVVDRA
jgi:hypothetical protein